MISKKSSQLMMLCWLVYSCSYIGKLSYNANIIQIGNAYSTDYAAVGMVSTLFFFVYGAGQIFNGIFCKRYNIKAVIFAALTVSATMNLLVAITPSFELIKYFWIVNGAAMSFLWTSLIRLLSETLPCGDIPRATVVMGTTVATGTFIVYGLSSIFAATLSYRATFITAASAMIAVAIIWLIAYDPLVSSLKEQISLTSTPCSENEAEKEQKVVASKGTSSLPRNKGGIMIFLAVVAIFAVADNFIKDGLTSWTPDILASLYSTPDWLSILLTLLLPVLAILGSFVAVYIQKRTKSFILSITLLFVVSSLLIGTVILFISTSLLPVTIACFALVSCLMAGVNNVITSMIPLELKEKMNSGRLAGMLNGFCYLGSTISSFGLGLVADSMGWNAVFYVLLSVSVGVMLVGIGYCLFYKVKKKTAS